ncbi:MULTISPECIES: bifunctional homocysteine S-methyltransferase/methylenetetrahydrofolate reductase [Acidobacterium]|uniref:Homocysteine S-methyltransferase/methylenetetrahydrofolate reductase n=1 Tax=Acidobacterium capsulatum (strain ATCC 51196 / DSM 11244 / BCRC 80197 / JCM 7670 / NBRC 15755 / NCIMB 13165 / 161) TaxID=240015 RepID=C1F3L2_ACIC5|nr:MULTISPECIES: bifunctional homocysteine S-methyltransferase/methylenetetrahydrofolate reductase [Acidobacterium]ACO33263.1 homocysteine S-methyltransferase/methylenetetrahydrofolate reductase [Acidobacterium capsulatum ATCC 51196]HCT60237.1 bifunctional homocysteine S-methyltransferase/methylenetetrahydrofolate reductase [Acidobacterium sp.]
MNNRLKEIFGDRPVLCDGAMGTSLYARGIFINRCFDELNLSQPELVRSVHEDYLQAGAEIIETNTFGANAIRLRRYGLQDKVAEINQAGARIARAAVAQLADKQAGNAWVAGSVGPLGVRLEPLGKVGLDEAQAIFAEQIEGLVAGGVDLLVIETMPALNEAQQAIRAARAVAPELPVIAMVTVDEESRCLDGTAPEVAAARLAGWGADAVGVNCSTGPAAVLTAIECMAEATDLPLAAMPNAGMPRAVDGRNIYLCSPEYMASFARKFHKSGVQFLGGCCGTTPNHIRAMKSFLRASEAQKAAVQHSRSAPIVTETPPAPIEQRSRLGQMIHDRTFVTMVEIVPPRGIDCQKEIDGATMLAGLGVHVINVPDSPRASARMSAQSLCIQLQQKSGIETLLHYTCRDRNVLSIQSDLLGASSIGLRNILCLTGDPPKLGNYPDATAVFDVDAIGLVNIVRRLNHGLDIGGNPIGASTGFTIGCAANPGVPDIDNEVRRFAYKVEAGAEYAITQPVFDLRILESFLKRIEGFRIPVIAGIWPLTSLRNAEFMRNDLRVSVPDSILLRMQQAATPELARAEGIRIAQEMLETARPMVEGVQVSAPFGRYTAAAEVLAGILPGTSKSDKAQPASEGMQIG